MVKSRLVKMNGVLCKCGKAHEFKSDIISGSGVIVRVVDAVREYGAKKPYILADKNTYSAAGVRVCEILDGAGISYESFIYPDEWLHPDEHAVGAAIMNMPLGCDMIIAVGSGVINDTAKIVSAHKKTPFVIIATAPSMDGYASMSSSVTLGAFKISLPSRCADVIIGDTDIIAKAPKKLQLAGVGDMLAKYVSICEWRISNLVCGEYYCEEIAALIRLALGRIIKSADELVKGDADAAATVFDGLSAGSVGMNYADSSRPASGVEHYISHVYDMRGVTFGERTELHGIQCGIGTLIAVRFYKKLKDIKPDRERALAYVNGFDVEQNRQMLLNLLGASADGMIRLDEKEQKYDLAKHKARLNVIIDKWDEIVRIIDEELPDAEWLESFMKRIGMATDFSELGMDASILPDVFKATKDIRDKYVLSKLLWDIGMLDELASELKRD